MHQEILDQKRQSMLPQIARVGAGFYLAGGTALALQLGHRDSIDFDFFCPESFDTVALHTRLTTIFSDVPVSKMQDETNTLTVLIDDEVQLSFFAYEYPLLEPLQIWEGLSIASITDIAAMKLSAITSRSTLKDYVDLYTILQHQTLPALLEAALRKFPNLNRNLILKSLVYFADIHPEPIQFMPGYEVDQTQIEAFLTTIVRKYQAR